MLKINRQFYLIPLIAALLIGLLWLLTPHHPVSAQTPSPTPVSSNNESQVIRVGGSSTNPPFEYLDNGQPAGFNIDLIQAVSREMGFDIEVTLTTPEQARQDLLDGKLDMLAGMAYSTNRDSQFDFSIPITYTSFTLFVRSDSGANSLEDVRGKEIIIQSGTAAHDYLVEERFTSKIVLVNDHADAIRLLSKNKFDGAILNRTQAEYLIGQMGVTNIRRVSPDLFELKFAFAVAEGNRELLAKLNEGLYSVNSTGELQDIQEKWFGVYQKKSTWETLRPLIIGLGAVLALLIISLIFTWSMHRRVQVRTSELRKSENHYRLLVDNLSEGIMVTSSGNIIFSNSRAADIFGYQLEEIIGKPINFLIHPEDAPAILDRNQRREKGEDVLSDDSIRVVTRSREIRWVNVHVVLIEWEGIPATLMMITDTTESRRAEDQIQQQLKQMAALRAVDMAITASMDLPLTLRVLLEQVTSQLNVDAASVLLLEEDSQLLAYAAGQGFTTNAIREVRLQMGHGFAGQAALHRKLLRVDNLTDRSDGVFPPHWVTSEGFVAYIGVPLITKGVVTGVLEIFQRSSLSADSVWMNFLEAIANQAAIAIDNARLLKDLQTANLDLTLAYDATIEGWAHALELRDGETEGHSHRVAALTVALASEMGLNGEVLLHIRRGALLHDIGKMAIPDDILKKQDRLTDEEWEIMRKHPIYSVQMLEPIDFLRPALSIPQAHHEWWDGSGYPRKLMGEEIPLAARIFAVIDVWDALIYSRRYREKWEKDRVKEYLLSLSGKQFDPSIVTKFLTFIENNGNGLADGEPEKSMV